MVREEVKCEMGRFDLIWGRIASTAPINHSASDLVALYRALRLSDTTALDATLRLGDTTALNTALGLGDTGHFEGMDG